MCLKLNRKGGYVTVVAEHTVRVRLVQVSNFCTSFTHASRRRLATALPSQPIGRPTSWGGLRARTERL